MPTENRTPKDAPDPRPVHERIATDLRREIVTGVIEPGAPLPSTEKLKERFGASSATVQKAVTLLKGEGLAVGRAGASVTALAPQRHTLAPAASSQPAGDGEKYRWLTEAEKAGKRPGVELLEVGEVAAPVRVAAAMGLIKDEQVLLRKQVMLSNDDRVIEVTEMAKAGHRYKLRYEF
jgi:GntR family transcriptional regulator